MVSLGLVAQSEEFLLRQMSSNTTISGKRKGRYKDRKKLVFHTHYHIFTVWFMQAGGIRVRIQSRYGTRRAIQVRQQVEQGQLMDRQSIAQARILQISH